MNIQISPTSIYSPAQRSSGSTEVNAAQLYRSLPFIYGLSREAAQFDKFVPSTFENALPNASLSPGHFKLTPVVPLSCQEGSMVPFSLVIHNCTHQSK